MYNRNVKCFYLEFLNPVPVSVAVHPQNQTVDLNSTVRLTCAFEYAREYNWYKDGLMLPNTKNIGTLTIQMASPKDIGYYSCKGKGITLEAETHSASVYVKGMNDMSTKCFLI